MRITLVALSIAILAMAFPNSTFADEAILKAGIIGCDTSHVIAFTELINNPEAAGPLANIEVVYAFPGGSDDIPDSYERLPKFTKLLKEKGIEIVDSVEELAEKSDVILLESVDGRKHWPQFRKAAVGKPVFIDKPIGASLADTLAIFRLAEKTGTPCFSSSGLRYCANVTELMQDESLGELLGASTAGPYVIEPHHPDFLWYGIHGIESLYTLLGPGCEEVSRTESDLYGVVVGRWPGGRIGTFRGIKKGHQDYTFTVFGTKAIAFRKGASGYGPLVNTICEFLISGKPPVDKNVTIEMIAFMEAADESKKLGGQPVKLETVMKRAEQEIAAKK